MPSANPIKRKAMEELLRRGNNLESIASELGYANGRSALVMAHRWNLHTLRKESYSNPNRRNI